LDNERPFWKGQRVGQEGGRSRGERGDSSGNRENRRLFLRRKGGKASPPSIRRSRGKQRQWAIAPKKGLKAFGGKMGEISSEEKCHRKIARGRRGEGGGWRRANK